MAALSVLSVALSAPHTCTVANRPATVRASSELASARDPGRYGADKAFDGDRSSAWVEGQAGTGEGERIDIDLDTPIILAGVLIVPGYTKSSRTFAENLVPTSIQVLAGGTSVGSFEIGYDAHYHSDTSLHGGTDCLHTAAPVNTQSVRLIVFDTPVKTKTVAIVLEEVIGGKARYDDCAISEIELIEDETSLRSAADRIAFGVLRRIASNRSLPVAAEARIEKLGAKKILSGGMVHPRSRPATYLHLVRRYLDRSGAAVSDTARIPDPRDIGRLADPATAAGRSPLAVFIDANAAGFVNATVTVLHDEESTILIGARTWSSLIEADEFFVTYGFPVLKLDAGGTLVEAGEVEESKEDGVVTYLPSP
jgi:hypothetical protein